MSSGVISLLRQCHAIYSSWATVCCSILLEMKLTLPRSSHLLPNDRAERYRSASWLGRNTNKQGFVTNRLCERIFVFSTYEPVISCRKTSFSYLSGQEFGLPWGKPYFIFKSVYHVPCTMPVYQCRVFTFSNDNNICYSQVFWTTFLLK